jgi:hypothetical protein
MLDRHHEARDRGGWDGRRWRKMMAAYPDSGDTGEEDGADLWVPHVSDWKR